MLRNAILAAAIVSATSVEQLRELVGALDLRLDAETTETLDKASAWRDAV